MKKIIIFIFMLIVFSSFTNGALIDNQVAYYKFDTNNANQPDSHDTHTAVVTGATFNTAGFINGAYDYNGTTDYMTITDHADFDSNSRSVSLWINLTDNVNTQRIYEEGASFYLYTTVGLVRIQAGDGGGYSNLQYSADISGSWTHVVAVYETGVGTQLYINGASVKNDTTRTGNYLNPVGNYLIGKAAGGSFIEGRLDEFGIWNKALTIDEVIELYNAGAGLQYPYVPATELITTLVYPTNATHYNIENLNTSKKFNGSIITSTNKDATCNIKNTGITQYWNNVTINTSSQHFTNITGFIEGNYSINITCTDGTNTTLTKLWFIIDETNVIATVNIVNNSIQANNFNLTIDYFDLYLYKTNTTVIRTNDNLTLYSNYSGVLGYETEWFNVTFDVTLLNSTYVVGDEIKVIVNGIDTHTANKFKERPEKTKITLGDKNIKQYNLKHGKFRLEYSKDMEIEEEYSKDRMHFKLKSDKLKNTNTYQYVEADKIVYYENSNYPCHMIVNDKYWYDCVGMKDPKVTKERNNRYKIDFFMDKEEVITKSLGGLNEIATEYFFTINKNYTGNILQGDFFNPTNALFNYTSLYNFSVTSLLVDTDCITVTGSNITSYDGSYCYNFSEIELEDVVLFAGATDIDCYVNVSNSTGNIIQTNFNWNDKNNNILKKGFNLCDSNSYCTLDELSGSFIVSNDSITCQGIINNSWFDFSKNSNTLNTSEVGLCNNASLIYPIANFSYFDELTNDILEVSASYDLTFYEGTSTFNIQSNNTGNYTTFCTDVNPASAVFNLKLYNTIIISSSNYITRVFNIPFSQGLDVSNKPYYNYSYYLIKVANSTTITYTWKDTDYGTLNGIMQIYRCEDDGTRTLIESTNVAGGKATANLQLFSTPYSYSFTTNDVTYTEPEYYDCHIESTDTQTYYVDISQIDVKPVIGLYLMDCHIYNVSSTIVKMDWDGNDEDATDIEACIVGYREDIYGRSKVYESCVNQSSGSLTRNIGLTGFNYYVQGTLEQNGVTGKCQETVVFNQRGATSQSVGITGVFLAAILIIALALLVAGDNILVILSSIVAILVVWLIGIVTLSWITVSSVIILGIIIALIGRHTLKGV